MRNSLRKTLIAVFASLTLGGVAHADVQIYPVVPNDPGIMMVAPDIPWGMSEYYTCVVVDTSNICTSSFVLRNLINGNTYLVPELNNEPNLFTWGGWGPGGSFYYWVNNNLDPDGPWQLQLKRLYNFLPATAAAPDQEVPSDVRVWGGRDGVHYTLPDDGHVKLGLYDVSGRKVASLLNGPQAAGVHYMKATGGIRPGVYFARLETGSQTGRGKMIIVR